MFLDAERMTVGFYPLSLESPSLYKNHAEAASGLFTEIDAVFFTLVIRQI
jgi:hypothetical protein